VEACISPYIDLSDGYDRYLDQRRENTREITQALRKARKASREEGAVRFVMQSTDPAAWEALIRWKTAQYKRTGATNVFAYRWALDLLKNLSRISDPMFAGCLSALYFDDKLVAVHLGMRSEHVLHWWFPAYDASMGKYSPGMILLLETAKAASQLEIHRIDLGKGAERYKLSLMSGSTTVYEGAVDYNRFIHSARVKKASTRRWLLSTKVGSKVKLIIKALR
jgi:CelD/BcsL family acetyltransferase involved in cellulose biosynthesis